MPAIPSRASQAGCSTIRLYKPLGIRLAEGIDLTQLIQIVRVEYE